MVPDGLQAIREFAGRKYNLVITDLATGKPLSNAQTEAIADAGILQIIRKPFRTSEIVELRNTYLGLTTHPHPPGRPDSGRAIGGRHVVETLI